MLSNEHIVAIGEQLGPQHLPVDDLAVGLVGLVRVDDIQLDGRVVPFAAIFNVRLDKQKIFGRNIRVADVN